ncbi:hypothetical protein [Pectobacterium sp. B1J-3]|uniref:hypothetical protein n=1 Tax=Pectobacterium sp. B1J-3 TaxID=3385371 RepID=UPI00390695FD
MMKKIFISLIIPLLASCSNNRLYDQFPATNGTIGMAYCVRGMWQADAIVNKVDTDAITLIENRSGMGSFYVYEHDGNEFVSIIGTNDFWGKNEGDIDVRFYVPKDKAISPLTKRRYDLTKMCAKMPTQEREKLFIPNVICTDQNGCDFRKRG